MHELGDRVLASELPGTFDGRTDLETECSGAYLIQLLQSYGDKHLFDLGGEAVPILTVRAKLKAASTFTVCAIEFWRLKQPSPNSDGESDHQSVRPRSHAGKTPKGSRHLMECPNCDAPAKQVIFGLLTKPPTPEEEDLYIFGGCVLDHWTGRVLECTVCHHQWSTPQPLTSFEHS
jgi:hypothetical protein